MFIAQYRGPDGMIGIFPCENSRMQFGGATRISEPVEVKFIPLPDSVRVQHELASIEKELASGWEARRIAQLQERREELRRMVQA